MGAERLSVHGVTEQERCQRLACPIPAEPAAEAGKWNVWAVTEQALRLALAIVPVILPEQIRRRKIVIYATEAEGPSVHGVTEQERCQRRVCPIPAEPAAEQGRWNAWAAAEQERNGNLRTKRRRARLPERCRLMPEMFLIRFREAEGLRWRAVYAAEQERGSAEAATETDLPKL